jgi:hypothetical protein
VIAVAAEITAITVWTAEEIIAAICVETTEALWNIAERSSTTADAAHTAPVDTASEDVITVRTTVETIEAKTCAAEIMESPRKK